MCFADNDPRKHGQFIGNIPICSPSKAAALLPDLIILGVLDEERRGSMMQQMEHLGYHGSFCDPSALRMFDARVAVMCLLAEQIHQQNIPGDVAELGVFQGDFSCLISTAFPDRKIHLFDTFEGFSEKDIAVETSRHLSRAKTGDFSSTDVDSVLRIMPDPSHVIIHKGWFPDTFSDITDETFCFVSLDADLYAPTAAALPLFYERLSIGGVLLIHDVYSTQFSGCNKAVDEFCLKHHLFADPVCDLHGSAIIRKII
ncbi:TylF/MycF/NovP-related O-methyltransferase [Blautia fusiformis]